MEKSRSELKKRALEIERLASALIDLPPALRASLPDLENLAGQISAGASMKGGARKRHVKHVARLIEKAGTEDILYRFISGNKGKAFVQRQMQLRIEEYRNALIDEAIELAAEEEDAGLLVQGEVLAELQAALGTVESHELARLAWRFAQTRNPLYSRELARALKAAFERAEREQGY